MVLTTLFAALALAQTPTSSPPFRPLYRAVQGSERKVSLRVNDASLKDVLSKLPKVDYVVDADAFKARRITLSLTDVTTSEALDAIAAAIDAHWETVGGVRVLKKGMGFGLNETFFKTFTPPQVQSFGDGKTLFKAMPRFEMKELLKDGKGFQRLSPEQKKSMQKAIDDAQKSLKAMPDVSIEVQKALEGARKAGKDAWGPERFGASFDELMKSLTPTQKALHKSQGYLKLSDLTPEQRKMAGITDGGTIELTISRDGETLKIKKD